MEPLDEIDALLKRANLKITPTRKRILKEFRDHPFALSYHDIETAIKEHLDKVTIYRTLKTFEEKGIIHQVLDTSNQVKHALCSTLCSDHKHHDAHIHFKCMVCEQILCIDNTEIPPITLPKKFKQVQSYMLVEGVCDKCNQA